MNRPLLPLVALALVATPVAAADHYRIDPDHTYPSIEFPHMGLSVWRGKFDRTRGSLELDRAAHTGTVEVTVDTASIDFGLQAMDDKARTADFLDTGTYPTATYRGTLRFTGEVATAVDGELTFRGMTHPLRLTIVSFTCMQHPYFKKPVCGADATGDLHWADYGMKKYGEGDADKITFRIQVEALGE